MTTPQTPPGWYHGQGDPPGTKRWWDGNEWTGEPQLLGDVTTTNAGSGTPAPVGRRVVAKLIDWAVILLTFIPLIAVVIGRLDFDALPDAESDEFQSAFEDQLTAVLDGSAGSLVLPMLIIAIGLLWEIVWVGAAGTTLGKKIMGLRIQNVKTGDSPPGWLAAVLRNLLRILLAQPLIPVIGFAFTVIALPISLIMLFVHPRKQTVLDLIASTEVVRAG